jgi:hypothetical protein
MTTTDDGGARDGLRTPDLTALDPLQPPRRRSRGRLAMQVVGVAVGLSLLGWAISIAFSEKNRAGIDAIARADVADVVLLVGLTVGAIVLNGVVFWFSQPFPPRKVPMGDAVAGNAIATFLGLVPFKISVVVRGLIHHRRNGVRFGELAAWFAAIAAMALGTLIPVGLVTFWRRELDAMWWIASIGSVAVVGVVGVTLGRLAGRYRVLHRLSVGADRIVRHPGIMAINLVLRFADVLLFSWRFQVAGRIVGVELPFEQAALLGAGYFLIVVLAPAGPLGFAEMGVAGLASLVGEDTPAIALLALVITAGAAATSLALSVPAAVMLRLDRVFGPGRTGAHRSP